MPRDHQRNAKESHLEQGHQVLLQYQSELYKVVSKQGNEGNVQSSEIPPECLLYLVESLQACPWIELLNP